MDWLRRFTSRQTQTSSTPVSPWLHTNPTLSQGISTSDCDEDNIYHYTSGRWLWNEKEQLSRRDVKFSLAELVKTATDATGSKSCVEVQKLPEGNFSKVFLLTMEDGKEVIAKLPNPNAGPHYFTTASEVATMDYVRNVLNIPAPTVYAWSPSTEEIGAEYIIMEKSRGVELSKLWDDIPGPDKLQIVQQLAEFEKALVSTQFPMYGSIYYADNLHNVHPNQMIELGRKKNTVGATFAVGPTTNRMFFDDGRNVVDAHRGPWASIEDYHVARANRELACLQTFSKFPRPQGLFYGPGQYQPNAQRKQETLQNFLKVSKFLSPKDTEISKPVLWHPDLHGDNIFVNPDQPTEILSIIDWQAVNLSPLFLQARRPALIEFDGPIPEGLQSIRLPDNFDELSPEEQLGAKKLRAAQSLYKLYDIQMMQDCPDIAAALKFKNSLAGQIAGLSGSLFSDGEPIVQGMLIKLQEEWETRVGPSIPCPLSFTAEDKEQQKEDEAKWASGVELMEEFLGKVGAYRGWDGWVNHNSYAHFKAQLEKCRDEFLNSHSTTSEERSQWESVWPFTDK
ncbi:Aminoglycoside phosphotransferase [Penicillium cf. griseofulvum]|uniref:Altered inheritance of mitochondria protein 9, mitochondrial n=1 Tax=Penicillium cf. griseofulvum TaxID=2972120 RepID=A0A9W9M9W1_9EURO|nr:Aminoglycoside phosphotransferase [Penicillium cf. griseofulvum]KAJ5445318.1 Aminoglycoside phosphotransferase [Penicillium cf. griseofulvum]